MSVQTDFYLTIERAAGLTLEATCSARAAAAGPLPHPHRRLIGQVIRSLERAQDDLYKARNDPWSSQQPKPARQLALL